MLSCLLVPGKGEVFMSSSAFRDSADVSTRVCWAGPEMHWP